jgi:Fe2+ or Zn2+ uptake regulation protein
MAAPVQLICNDCGELSDMEMQAYVAPDGERIEWPKAEAKDGQLCFMILCPNCGARQQCIAPAVAK